MEACCFVSATDRANEIIPNLPFQRMLRLYFAICLSRNGHGLLFRLNAFVQFECEDGSSVFDSNAAGAMSQLA
jgi:hypothetical protein